MNDEREEEEGFGGEGPEEELEEAEEEEVVAGHEEIGETYDMNDEREATEGYGGEGLEEEEDEDSLSAAEARRRFVEFVRGFRQNRQTVYREQLLRRFRLGEGQLSVELDDLNTYDGLLYAALEKRPTEVLRAFESAARDVLRESLASETNNNTHSEESRGNENAMPTFSEDYINVEDPEAFEQDPATEIQITLSAASKSSMDFRGLTADHVNRLVKISGIVISASKVKHKATIVHCVCSWCLFEKRLETPGPFQQPNIPVLCPSGGRLARDAQSNQMVKKPCGQNPFVVCGDACAFIDQQTLRLQEKPEDVPTGQIPRAALLVVDRRMVDVVAPGARVSVLAVSSLFEKKTNSKSGIRTPYMRVIGVEAEDLYGNARFQTMFDKNGKPRFTPSDEERFLAYSRRPDIHQVLSRSIAPSISGDYTKDIKRALACQLVGGARKTLKDGAKLRGDINVLLMGDPSTAKSQFLKFIEKVAPVGVYTSGKGSSAAGLTASVVRDKKNEFYLEGGAMVLADGGICCIDEFDKMREVDRVAIHEAMEQQTISIAKAGICTVLNTRTSVLAAANPVFGRYDDLKSASENIDMMSTILSRFDCIFIVRDVRDEARDIAIAKHVMSVHVKAGAQGDFAALSDGRNKVNIPGAAAMTRNANKLYARTENDQTNNQLSSTTSSPDDPDLILEPQEIRDYISYCRAKCSPRLTEETSAALASEYVAIRQTVKQQIEDNGGRKHAAIPITVRQLEALVRLSESVAKMRLSDDVDPADMAEAIRLFKVSTMAAAKNKASGPNADLRFLSDDFRSAVANAETFLKQRLAVGATATTARITEEAIGLQHSALAVRRAISVMLSRNELSEHDRARKIKRLR